LKRIIDAIKATTIPSTATELKQFIEQFNLDEYDYAPHLSEPETKGDYGRNIFTLDPFECVLINWPANTESGIHHHDGLFGYVLVLEGEIENICYRKVDGILEECEIQRYGRGALIYEPDGVIHKIKNARSDTRAVSIHFYYPPLRTLGGLRIFDIERRAIGVLSDEAKTASWSDEDGHFTSLEHDAFEFKSFDELNAGKSHIISNVLPKPATDRINQMNAIYFSEQAAQYDFYDFNLPKRKSYVDTIDELIANELTNRQVKSVIDIACGTGRRAVNIRSISGLDYEISGIDISEKMCEEARKKGIDAHHEAWLSSDEHSDETFSCATFLYAFGHIPSRELRLLNLKKIGDHLESGGLLCFDVFNQNDQNEWGPLAVKAYENQNLADHGYEPGDVFYRKNGFKSAAFVHYFTKNEVERLLDQAGFDIEKIHAVGYSKNAGEIQKDESQGNLLFIARKR
jgi:ubiquinone/menaquinone biosynthesis C-methylase UbiE/predicted metal-dependent enzyme (double-stranded beta helix superfamily)